MNTGEIILLVLGVIIIVLAVKGKPLWNNWGKPLWSFLKQYSEKHPDVKIWVLIWGFVALAIFLRLIYWDEVETLNP